MVHWTVRRSNSQSKGNVDTRGRTGAEAETQANIACHIERADPLEKTQLEGARGKRRRATEDQTVGWHHDSMDRFRANSGDSERDRKLACCSPWGDKIQSTD